MATVNITRGEEAVLTKAERVLLRLILEQINLLRVRAGLVAITPEQAVARFWELLRDA